MTSYYSTEAVLLNTLDSGEADRYYTFYTQKYGKVGASAKSVRREKSKLRGHLQSLGIVNIMFIGIKGGHRLIDASLIKGPDMEAFERNARFAKFMLSLVNGSERDDELWKLVRSVYSNSREDGLFSLKAEALGILGMLPEEGVITDDDMNRVLSANHVVQ